MKLNLFWGEVPHTFLQTRPPAITFQASLTDGLKNGHVGILLDRCMKVICKASKAIWMKSILSLELSVELRLGLVPLMSCGIPHTHNQRAGDIQTLGSFRYTESSSVAYNFCYVSISVVKEKAHGTRPPVLNRIRADGDTHCQFTQLSHKIVTAAQGHPFTIC